MGRVAPFLRRPAGWLLPAVFCLMLSGCPRAEWSGLEAARRHIDSDRVADRVRATAILGQYAIDQPNNADLKRLIDRLEDIDAAVRLYAITALAPAAGGRMGYQPGSPLAERHAAVRRWRAWYAARVEGGS